MVKKIIAKTPKQTAEIAQVFLDEILREELAQNQAEVIGLSGNLGAGKTTFVQAVAKHLGIKNKVISPTFVIIKRYALKKNLKYKNLFHVDAYRVKSEHELALLGWQEMIANPENIVFIEWPENVKGLLPKHAKNIQIAHGDQGERHFTLKQK